MSAPHGADVGASVPLVRQRHGRWRLNSKPTSKAADKSVRPTLEQESQEFAKMTNCGRLTDTKCGQPSAQLRNIESILDEIRLTFSSTGGSGWIQPAFLRAAASRCDNAPDYFQPMTQGDGLRYPLTIGPLVWHLVGSGVYPVDGADGLTHLAFAMQFTDAWGIPATIQSVEVVDPAQGDKVSGTNRVVSIKDEDVTGQVKLLSRPGTMDKASYSSKIGGGESGVMFFDVTYPNSDAVPCAIALRVHALQPDNPHLPESTVTSPPIKVSSQSAIVLTPPFKGDGWMNVNGCCLEIGPHRFVTNPMNGTLDPSEQFAIDWIKVDDQGKAFRGDGKKSEDWFCYGVEVLAVGPGVWSKPCAICRMNRLAFRRLT